MLQPTEDGQVTVKGTYKDGSTEFEDSFDTVVFAIGRDAETSKLGLDKVGFEPTTVAH